MTATVQQTNESSIPAAHTTVVSIGVILLVIIVLVTIGGESHTAALGVMALFLSVIIIAGFRLSPAQLNTISSYPSVP